MLTPPVNQFSDPYLVVVVSVPDPVPIPVPVVSVVVPVSVPVSVPVLVSVVPDWPSLLEEHAARPSEADSSRINAFVFIVSYSIVKELIIGCNK